MSAFLVAAAAVWSAPPTVVQLETDLGKVPPGWSVEGPAPKDAMLELHFMVKQQNLDRLHDVLLEVSMPTSPSYGKHLSNEAVNEMTRPRDEDIAALQAYVPSAVAATPNKDMFTATMTIREAELLLNAQYEILRHTATGHIVHRCRPYSVPAAYAQAIDFIAPTVHIPGVRSVNKSKKSQGDEKRTAALQGNHNVPKTLRELYSIGDTVVGKHPKNKMAVTAFLGQAYDLGALQLYYTDYCEPNSLTCGKGEPALVGDATTGSPGVESMLDIESITGVAGNVSAEFWGFAGHSPDNPDNEPFMKWLAKVASTGDDTVPKLFSTSYGEDESSWSLPAATRLNGEFMKAGARGISLLYASGDEGANCKRSKYVPEGPGSSPYVLAVGGTTPAAGYPSPGSEEGVGLSSGGFSSYWAMPDWQKSAVVTYLSTASGLPPTKVGYNTSNRAYPDISAQATDFCVTPFGCSIAGTSCATPTASGVFALLNDLRLQAGKPTLGFLNPFVYANANAFFDVTQGASTGGCGFSSTGWPTAEGWDAVTGVGTPNYEKLAKAVAALP